MRKYNFNNLQCRNNQFHYSKMSKQSLLFVSSWYPVSKFVVNLVQILMPVNCAHFSDMVYQKKKSMSDSSNN